MKRFKVFGTVASLLLSILTVGLAAAPAHATGVTVGDSNCDLIRGTDDGSQAHPFQIGTADDLAEINDCASGNYYYEQTDDLDLHDLTSYTPGDDWNPIGQGYGGSAFRGSYDGKNHKITNFDILDPVASTQPGSIDYQGLFGFATDSTFKNLVIGIESASQSNVINGIDFTGDFNYNNSSSVGVLVGDLEQSSVQNVKVFNYSLKGRENIGGIVGTLFRSTISQSTFKGKILPTDDSQASYNIGGISGISYSSTFTNVKAEVDIINSYVDDSNNSVSGARVGGIVGNTLMSSATIFDAEVTGTIVGSEYVGGIAGNTDCSTTILNSNFTGSVGTPNNSNYEKNSNHIGGIVGNLYSSSVIDNAVTTGDVEIYQNGSSRASEIGGIAGESTEATIKNTSLTGDIKFTNFVDSNSENIGGLVGKAGKTILTHNYVLGNVLALSTTDDTMGASSVGGLIGLLGYDPDILKNNFVRGSVSGQNHVGGFIGYYDSSSLILSQNYSTGKVSSTTPEGTDVDAFANWSWTDARTSEQNTFDNETSQASTLTNLVGHATADMKTQSTFTALGFDFDSAQPVWAIDSTINDGYPFLVGSPLDTRTNSGGGSGGGSSSGDSSSGSTKTITNTVITPATESLGTFAFAPGSSKLSAKAKAKLNTLAKSIKAASYKQLTVRAYTSETDTKLSVARAKAISSYLKKKGVKVTAVNEAITRSSKSLNYKVKIFGKK